jgi:type I restriction enzyme M protein
VGLIWPIAHLLRGDHKRAEYQKVILPLVLLRRLECLLESTNDKALARLGALAGAVQNVDPILQGITRVEAYNTSRLTLHYTLADASHVAPNSALGSPPSTPRLATASRSSISSAFCCTNGHNLSYRK